MSIVYRHIKTILPILNASLIGVLIAVVGAITVFISQIFLGRWLGAEQFGYYILATAWLNIIIIFAKAGMQGTVIKYVSTYHARKDWSELKGLLIGSLKRALITSSCVGACFCIAVFLLRAAIPSNIEPVLFYALLLTGALIPVRTLMLVKQSQLRGFHKLSSALIPDSIIRTPLFTILCFITYLEFGKDFNAAYVIAMSIIAHAIILYLYWFISHYTFTPVLKNIKATFKNSNAWKTAAVFFAITALMQVLLRKTDMVMLGALSNAASAGVYGAVSSITGFMLMGFATLNTVFGPIASSLYEKKDFAKLWNNFNLVRVLIFLGYSSGAFFLYLFGEDVLSLYGEDFKIGYKAMIIFSLWLIPSAIGGCAVFLANMTRFHKRAAIWSVLVVILNVLLNYFLIRSYGIEGAAHATGISWLIYQTGLYFYLRTMLGKKHDKK